MGSKIELPILGLVEMLLKGILVAVIGGSLIGLTSITLLTAIAFPIIAIIAGWLIFRFAYYVYLPDELQSGYIVTFWNHLIVIIACLLGGTVTALTKLGICYFIFISPLTAFQSSTTCVSVTVLVNNLTFVGIVSSFLLFMVPGIFIVLYFFRK